MSQRLRLQRRLNEDELRDALLVFANEGVSLLLKDHQVLRRRLNEDELQDALLLVFVSKQYLPNALNATEITDKLRLQALT